MRRATDLLKRDRGFTLVELLVGLGILSVVMSIIGLSIFQALRTESAISSDGRAINQLRNGMSWFGEDGKMVQGTDLVDGGPAVQCVDGVPCSSFTWTDEFNDLDVAHSLSYTLVGNTLVRNYDGNAHGVAREVVATSFSRSGKTVTAQLEVDAGAGTTRVLTVEVYMELLQ